MAKTKKWSLLLVCTLMVSAVLAACGNTGNGSGSTKNASSGSSTASTGNSSSSSGSNKVQLMYYNWVKGSANDPESKFEMQVVNDWNARTDVNAKIAVQNIPGTPYYPKLNAAIAGNKTPDIFSVHAAGKLKTYADSGRILALNNYLDADPAWKNSFTSGAFNLLTFNNKIYAIPLYFATTPLFYNKDIFAKYHLQPPKTYDDLKNVIKVLVNNHVTPFAFGSKDAWTSALFSEIIANRIGGDEPFNKLMDGKGTWLDPSYIKTGQILDELKNMGAFPQGFLGLDNTAITNMFANGQAAMFVMGSWAIGSLTAPDSKVKNSVGIAKFPTFPGGKGDINTWLGQPSYNLAVSKTSKDIPDAIKFLKFYTSDKYEKYDGEVLGNLPSTKVKLNPQKVPQLTRDLQAQMSDMKGMFIFYDVGLGPKIGDEYNNTIQSILAGTDPKTAFQSLQTYTQDNSQ